MATAFKGEVIATPALDGIPYLPFVVVDYDQEFYPSYLKPLKKAFDKMVKALTTPAKELEKKIPGEMS